MTHNLVIRNDPESEYVTFDVEIPDGYNKFRLEYLNGSVINQNYLKVGDTLTFKFDNTPTRYYTGDSPIGYNLAFRDEYTDESLINFSYFIDLDVCKYARLVYLPIYQIYDIGAQSFRYIFNPCLKKDEYTYPHNYPMIDNLYDSDGLSYAGTFIGKFVMAYEEVDKIPDISVTIGESINNSRTRPQEFGSFQISANTVSEVTVSNETRTTYNYGPVWDTPVENQVLEHHETIYTECLSALTSDISLVMFRNNYNVSYVGSSGELSSVTYPMYLLSGRVISSNGIYTDSQSNEYKLYYYNTNTGISDIDRQLKTTIDNTPTVIPVLKSNDNGTNFSLIQYNLNTWLSGTHGQDDNNDIYILGGSIVQEGLYTYPADSLVPSAHTEKINPQVAKYGYIIADQWYYLDYDLMHIVEGPDWKPLKNTTLRFPTNGSASYNFSEVSSYSVQDNQGQTHLIRFQVMNYSTTSTISKYIYDTLKTITIYGDLTTNDEGNIVYVTGLCTGVLNPAKYVQTSDEPAALNLLQLTDSKTEQTADNVISLNTEDLYASQVTDGEVNGIKLSSMFPRNIIHKIKASVVDDVPTYHIEHYPGAWYPDGDYTNQGQAGITPLAYFIPLKTKRFVKRWRPSVLSPPEGWFEINNMDGNTPSELVDNQAEVYLASGHETLNVEPPRDDDTKFKTFNGTLVFDRSNSKITRIFSNDLTGACLGYINDILAARLSRYYTVVDYRIWNTFYRTKSTLPIPVTAEVFDKYYRTYPVSTGDHSYLLGSCQDMLKLIGSENVVNNCMDSLKPEQQLYNAHLMHHKDYVETDTPVLSPPEDYVYKFFHYYTAGIKDYPYLGYGNNDSPSTTIGGLNTLDLSDTLCKLNYDWFEKDLTNTVEEPIFKTDLGSTSGLDTMNAVTYPGDYPTNKHLNYYGFIETLPVYRLYRNSNFEQNDLSITTGGIKLLHPIYLQSTPRILMNNIAYTVDRVIQYLINTYKSLPPIGDILPYFTFGTLVDYDGRVSLNEFDKPLPLMRFFPSAINIPDSSSQAVPVSIDSWWMLNYLDCVDINIYQSVEDMKESIPTGHHNEEAIKDMTTVGIETNCQLFSHKYFRFLDNVSYFNLVTFQDRYVEAVYYNLNLLNDYYSIPTTEEEAIKVRTQIYATVDNYIGNISSYNNLKTCKVFICKLGEFLDFPRLFYLGCETFSNMMRLSIWNYNITKYKGPIETSYKQNVDSGQWTEVTTTVLDRPEQRINTYMNGVIFRYHQLAHGYQNFPNELTTEYDISRWRGSRHFTLTLYDEFGRRFPNEDTSQGYKNNLYVELLLE